MINDIIISLHVKQFPIVIYIIIVYYSAGMLPSTTHTRNIILYPAIAYTYNTIPTTGDTWQTYWWGEVQKTNISKTEMQIEKNCSR